MQYKSTIGADFLTKEITIDGSVVQLQVKIKKYNNKIKKTKKKNFIVMGYSRTRKISCNGSIILS